jgi:hypothetical protein
LLDRQGVTGSNPVARIYSEFIEGLFLAPGWGTVRQNKDQRFVINMTKKYFFSLLSIVISSVTFYLICLALHKYYQLHPLDPTAYSRMFFNNSMLRPEPFERACYLIGIFYLPLSAILCYLSLNLVDRKYCGLFSFAEQKTFNLVIDYASVLAALVWGYCLLANARVESETGRFVLNYGGGSFLSIGVVSLALILLARIKMPAAAKMSGWCR